MRAAVYRRFGPAAEVLAVEEIETPCRAGPGAGPGGRVGREPDRLEGPLGRRTHAAELGGRLVPGPAPRRRRRDRRGRGGRRPGAGGRARVGAAGRVPPARGGPPPSTRWWRPITPYRCRTARRSSWAPTSACPAVTAHRCLFADGPLDGRTVLVAGGAGAVGHFAIELARAAGATVDLHRQRPGEGEARRGGRRPPRGQLPGRAPPTGSGPSRRTASTGSSRWRWRPTCALDLDVAAPYASIVTYAAEAAQPSLPTRELMTRNLLLRFVLLYTVPPEAYAPPARASPPRSRPARSHRCRRRRSRWRRPPPRRTRSRTAPWARSSSRSPIPIYRETVAKTKSQLLEVAGREVTITNPDKVVFAADRATPSSTSSTTTSRWPTARCAGSAGGR